MAKGTPAQVKALFASFGNYDWYGQCAGLLMTLVNHFGTKHGGAYPSAKAAYDAAKAGGFIEGTDWRTAPENVVLYWSYYGSDGRGNKGWFGHVGYALASGGREVFNASGKADTYWGKNAGLDTAADIDGRMVEFLGWSRRYGKHEIVMAADEDASAGTVKPVPATKQRTVRKGVFDKLNGRSQPSTKSGKVVQTLKPGIVGNFDGFKRGQKVTVGGVTSNVWFRGAFNGRWFAAAAFTSQSTSGLKDLGTYTEPSAPKKQYVRIPETYIWYDHVEDAVRAVDRHYSVPKGDYPLIRVDSRGPRLIQWGSRQVWVGSTKTRPAIITK